MVASNREDTVVNKEGTDNHKVATLNSNTNTNRTPTTEAAKAHLNHLTLGSQNGTTTRTDGSTSTERLANAPTSSLVKVAMVKTIVVTDNSSHMEVEVTNNNNMVRSHHSRSRVTMVEMSH